MSWSHLRAVVSTNPRKVLAVGDAIAGAENDVVLAHDKEHLAERRAGIAFLVGFSLVAKSAAAAAIALEAANNVPPDSLTGQLVNGVAGLGLALSFIADGFAVSTYSGSAQYYQERVRPTQEFLATPPGLG